MNRKIPIIIVCDSEIDRIPILHNTLRRLALEPKYEVQTLGRHEYLAFAGSNAGIYSKIESTIKNHFLLRNIKPLLIAEYLFKCYREIKKNDPSVLILVNSWSCFLAPFVKTRKTINWQLEFNSFSENGLLFKIAEYLSRQSWFCIDAFIFPTAERAAIAASHYSRLIKKEFIIYPNSTNRNLYSHEISTLKNVELSGALRYKASSSDNSLTICYAGSVQRRTNNLEIIIEAIRSIDNIRLIIVGFEDKLLRAEFEEKLKYYNIEKRVLLIDRLPYADLAQVLLVSDVGFVSYSGDHLNTFFSAPGKIYDYLSFGLIVLSDCFSVQNLEVIRCGAFYHRSKSRELSIANLKKRIERLIHEPRLTKQQIQTVFDVHYSLEVKFNELLDLINS